MSGGSFKFPIHASESQALSFCSGVRVRKRDPLLCGYESEPDLDDSQVTDWRSSPPLIARRDYTLDPAGDAQRVGTWDFAVLGGMQTEGMKKKKKKRNVSPRQKSPSKHESTTKCFMFKMQIVFTSMHSTCHSVKSSLNWNWI